MVEAKTCIVFLVSTLGTLTAEDLKKFDLVFKPSLLLPDIVLVLVVGSAILALEGAERALPSRKRRVANGAVFHVLMRVSHNRFWRLYAV